MNRRGPLYKPIVEWFCKIKRILAFSGFSRLERRLVEEVSTYMQEEAAAILIDQVSLTTRVEHFPRITNSVNIFQTHLIEIPKFPAQYIERTFATVSFRTSTSPTESFRVRLINVQGELFSITYSKYPSWKDRHFGEPIIEKVKFHYDLMKEVHESMEEWERKRKAKVGRLTGWLGEWQEKYGIKEMSKPATKKLRRERFKELEVVPPADYLELLDQVDGMTVGGVAILGVEEAYEVELPCGTYVLVAEAHTPDADVFHLLLKPGAKNGQVYRCHHEDLECVACGTSLRAAVEPFLAAEECGTGGNAVSKNTGE